MDNLVSSTEIRLIIQHNPNVKKRFKVLDISELREDVQMLTKCSFADALGITNKIVDEVEFYLNSTSYEVQAFKDRVITEVEAVTSNFDSLYYLLQSFSKEIESQRTK
jgi:hypothetical protein